MSSKVFFVQAMVQSGGNRLEKDRVHDHYAGKILMVDSDKKLQHSPKAKPGGMLFS